MAVTADGVWAEDVLRPYRHPARQREVMPAPGPVQTPCRTQRLCVSWL